MSHSHAMQRRSFSCSMWCSTTAVFVCSCQDTFEHFEDTRDLHKLWNVPQTRTDEHYHFRTSSNKMQTVLNISWTGGCLGSQPLRHRKLAMLRSRSMGSREGWGQGNPSKVQDVEYIIDENGGTTVSYTHLTLPTICSV